ncbi:MAG TPA: hypothetical protein VHW01_13710 [Polyangiaceae bacterium]|nr:hypothetical protein [Polyangiaceae bacterium]
MPRFATLLGAISLCAASILFARRSMAEAAPEPIDWSYSAPPDCPPADAFEREFRARTNRAELVAGVANASRTFLVTLSSEPGRAVGRIEIDGPVDAVATREVVGQTCGGVVSALALIAALAVDPLAGESPAVSSPPPRAEAAHLAPKSSPVAAPDVGEHVGRTSLPRTVLAVGLDGGVVLGLFPKPAPSVSVFTEARLERGSLLSPSARLSLSGAVSSSVAAPPGSAKFRWLAAALDGCPFELRLLRGLQATPCVFMEVGVLQGSGTGVVTPEVESRRWVALGGSGRLNWQLGPFFIEAQGRLEAPLARDTFVLTVPGRVVVDAVPAILGSFGLGAGVRWP